MPIRGVPLANQVVDAIVWYAAFIFATTIHEAAHALAAMRGGDTTAYEIGQVTIDPIPHIRREPVGMVVLPIIALAIIGWPFGYASTPYNIAWAERHPRRAAWMALAGPAANLGLVLICAAAIRIGVLAGVFHAPESAYFTQVVTAVGGGAWDAAAFIVSIFFTLNLILFLFNLLPLPPLDGSGALALILWFALFTYDATDPSFSQTGTSGIVNNGVGRFGALIAEKPKHSGQSALFFHPAFWALPTRDTSRTNRSRRIYKLS